MRRVAELGCASWTRSVASRTLIHINVHDLHPESPQRFLLWTRKSFLFVPENFLLAGRHADNWVVTSLVPTICRSAILSCAQFADSSILNPDSIPRELWVIERSVTARISLILGKTRGHTPRLQTLLGQAPQRGRRERSERGGVSSAPAVFVALPGPHG